MKKAGRIIGVTSLVIVGVNAVFGLFNYKKAKELHKTKDIAVTFGEEAIDMSELLKKQEIGAMFSSMTLDFSNCKESDEPYEIELYAKFTGIEIIVPEGWYVESKGKIAMASIENYTATYEDEKASVILHFNASFSGISIRNVKYS
jgi:hypothetical protein